MNKIYLDFLKRKVAFKLRKKLKNISRTDGTPKNANTLLVSYKHELSETMLYPFYWYENELKKKLGLVFCEIITTDLIDEVNHHTKITVQPQIKRIFFQAEYEMPAELMQACFKHLQEVYPNADIAFMDWYAPLHIRPSSIVGPYIDTYIKKQTYSDYSDYSKPTVGDTNLSDYYAKRHNLELETMQFIPPENFENKIMLWSNFGLSPQMIDLFLGNLNPHSSRPIDLHARLAVNGVPWYKAMRQESKDALDNLQLPELEIASEGRVKRSKFFKEMAQSKMCFSPFGYGEICWRDYEAFATGSLLLKPNMDHLRVFPDIFVADETYISLEWDLSDFKEKLVAYSQNQTARQRITANAFEAMKTSITNHSMVENISALYT
ncbi:hypothetical protein [Thiomicrorhabdus sp.]|uniref:hypothetical protein n=1 Tax=Thiomicrorhabdus sp. TaxID=2039724 RepID=UPI003562CEE5